MKFEAILFDSHCHLNSFSDIQTAEEYVTKAKKHSIEAIWDIATDVESSRKSIELAKNYSEIKSFIGVDPELFEPGSSMFKGFDETIIGQNIEEIEALINENREFISGIGETGIDNYWILEQDKETQTKSLELQEELFIRHINLSKKYKLPLTIHSRNYETQCLDILKSENAEFGIFHSFTGTYEVAKKILDAGYGLGVNGIITFKSANELREVYRKLIGNVPPGVGPKFFYDKGIFFETDAPFLAPEGKRGEQNEPSNIKSIFSSFVSTLS